MILSVTSKLNEHADPQENNGRGNNSFQKSKRQIDEGKQTCQAFHNHKPCLRGTVTFAFNIETSTNIKNEKMEN